MSKFDVSNLNFKSVKSLTNKDKSLPNLKKLEFNKDNQSLTVPNDNNYQDTNSQLQNKQKFGFNRNMTQKNYHQSQDNVSRKKGKSLSQHNINSISNNENTSFNINLVRENSKDEIIPNFGSYSSTSSYKLNQTTKDNVPIVSTQNKFLYDFDEESSMVPRENSQPNAYKIIVKNLENEIRDKKDEIKTLKKNFREKILLLEQENKLNQDMIENQYKIELSGLLKNHQSIIKNLNEENDLLIEKFENIIIKLANEKNQNKKNSIEKSFHEEKIKELNKIYEEKHEKLKENYDERVKQMIRLFENPLYIHCLEKIRYYNINKEKLIQVADVKLINPENKSELEYNVGDIYSLLDSIKFEQLKKCALYFEQFNEINYKCETILKKNLLQNKSNLTDLKEEVSKRFAEIENLSLHKDDHKYEINEIRKELNLTAKINNMMNSKPVEHKLKNEETELEFDKGIYNLKFRKF
jgi:hypothetical protein